MPASSSFTGAGFSLQSVTPLVPGTVRVRFTADPRQSNPAGATDGLNPANYTLTGPAAAPAISSVAVVSGDTQSLDLVLVAPLIAGVWTLAAANIQTPAGASLSVPTSLQFTVTTTGSVGTLAQGAKNDDAESVIRKHLSSALRGPNWDGLIAALSTGDDINWDNVQLAFDQLFKSTSSGKYLDRLAANDGLSRPAGVGMSDGLFRDLSIRTTGNKVTHEALREILEVFYSRDALRAYAETAEEEPFVLADGQTLTWKLDEDKSFTATFRLADFRTIGAAKALEVAALLTKTMSDGGSEGFSAVVTNAETGGKRVRIYSPSLGLKSFVRVTGGDGQIGLDFPTRRTTYSGTVTSGHGYNWVYTEPTPNVTRLSLTTTGQPLVDISTVEAGDYLIVGTDAQSAPGVYPVKGVSFSWTGGNLTQVVDLDQDIGFTGTSLQLSNSAYTFYAPTKRTILSGDRTVVVAQTQSGEVRVQIPATTQAVSRTARTGAYGRIGTALSVLRYVRDGDGVVTVETAAAHGLTIGKQVLVDGVQPQAGRPWVSSGADLGGNTGTTDASYGSCFGSTNNLPGGRRSKTGSRMTLLGNGDAIITGGFQYAGGGIYSNSLNHVEVFRVTGTTAVTDGSEAEGALRRSYSHPQTGVTMGNARQQHGISTLLDGRALVTAGLFSTTSATDPTILTEAEVSTASGSSFSGVAGVTLARFGHEQVTLDDGRVMVIGGAWNKDTATETVEFYNPTTDAWTTGPNMSEPRYGHRAVKLSDGRVMVIGGFQLGRSLDADASTLSYWKFDETGGPTAADSSGNGYTLTETGATSVAMGKVNRCREFGGLSYMTGAGDAAAQTALLGEWTVEFWLPSGGGTPGSETTIVAYMGIDETEANNALFQIGVQTNGKLFWKWENGAGADVRQDQTNDPAPTGSNSHVALRKRASGGNYDVDLFINGTLVQSWTGQANASGGSTSIWRVSNNGEVVNVGFGRKLDELRVSKAARSDDEIRQTFLKGMGEPRFPTATYGAQRDRGGLLHRSTEIFDPVSNTWSRGPDMDVARGGHTATLLPDDKVLVTGGIGRDPNEPLPAILQAVAACWPNQSVASTEVWDPNTNRWHRGPALRSSRYDHMAFLLPGRRQVWIAGASQISIDYAAGTATTGSAESVEPIQLYGVDSGTLATSFQRLNSSRDTGAYIGSDLILLGGGRDGNIDNLLNYDLWVPGADAVSGGGLNGLHRVTAVPSTTKFQFQTPAYKGYASNFGPQAGGRVDLDVDLLFPGATASRYRKYTDGGFIIATSASRTSNVTTLTVGSGHGLAVGDTVYANTNHSSFASGIKTLTAATATAISYAETSGDVGATTISGTVSKNRNGTATTTPLAAPTSSTTDPGPYVFDPKAGLGIRPAASSATVTNAFVDGAQAPIQKGGSYPALYLSSTTGLPKGGGYLVLDLGGPKQSAPIRYIEVIDTNVVSIDFGFVFQHGYGGESIILLKSRSPFAPAKPLDAANFYGTDSSIGRIAAEAAVRAAAAAGFEVDVDVVYPGDRGLGAEEYPTEGAGKLSDATRVWGGDS